MSTKIPYLDELYSPITGCSNTACPTRSSCWAKFMVDTMGRTAIQPKPFSKVHFHPNRLDKPLHWRKPRRIGVCFLGDWMDKHVRKYWIDRILEVIAACPRHQFFSLTKHPERLDDMIYGVDEQNPMRELGGGDYLPNLYLGVTVTNQADADRMIPELLQIPGKHWVSYEPALGAVDFVKFWIMKFYNCVIPRPWMIDINWLVIGSHNQPRKYPCKIEWIESAVELAQAANVPVFVKQADICGKLVKMPEILGRVYDQFPIGVRF